MLAGTSAAMLVGTCWKKFLSAFPLPSALLGTENFFPFYVLPVRPQQCLLVRVGKKFKVLEKILSVGKKFLSAFPMPLALLGTENFFPFYVLQYMKSLLQVQKVRSET